MISRHVLGVILPGATPIALRKSVNSTTLSAWSLPGGLEAPLTVIDDSFTVWFECFVKSEFGDGKDSKIFTRLVFLTFKISTLRVKFSALRSHRDN
jgi:hypothetical protein